jgi:TonB family protein
MYPGVQRYPRTKMVLPLRLWVGEDADDSAPPQLAHTVDISPIGGRLGGLRSELQPGQTVMLQRGQMKFPFRVIWNTELAPGENHAGVEALEFGNIWGVELPQSAVRAAKKQASLLPAASPAPTHETLRPPRLNLALRVPPILLDRKVQLGLCLGLLLLGGVLGLSLYRQIFGPASIDVHFAPPSPPSAADLTPPAPTPQQAPLVGEITTWHRTPVPRVTVAEPPTEHVVYPVSPDVRLSGKVHLSVVIATDGRVKQIRVLGGKPSLVRAAEQAVRQWRYNPYQVRGEPAEGETNVSVGFRGADAVSLEFPAAIGVQAK